MHRHLAITGSILGWGPVMSTIGQMLLLGGDLSSERLGKPHDTRRLRIRWA
jgi:hypothetical protein